MYFEAGEQERRKQGEEEEKGKKKKWKSKHERSVVSTLTQINHVSVFICTTLYEQSNNTGASVSAVFGHMGVNDERGYWLVCDTRLLSFEKYTKCAAVKGFSLPANLHFMFCLPFVGAFVCFRFRVTRTANRYRTANT